MMHFLGRADITGVLIGAVRSLPVLIVVLLSFPAWLLMPFLSQPRRDSILSELHRIQQWHVELLGRASPSLPPGTTATGEKN